MKRLSILFLTIIFFFSQKAFPQYSHTILLDEGEEFSYNLPYDITSKGGTGYWTTYSPSNVEIVKQSDESVTVKAIKYTFNTVLVQYDCYYYLSGYGGRITFDLYVNIRKPGSGSDSDTGSNIKDGDVFNYTYDGVSMQFKCISNREKTCMIGAGFLETDGAVVYKDGRAVPKSLSKSTLTIPKTAKGFNVVEIANCAFGECNKIKEIIMPETIIKIGDGAFQDCDGLTSITVPDAVTTIGYGAFSGCDKLEEVIIGKSVETIDGAFGKSPRLKAITLYSTEPPSISPYAFDSDAYNNVTIYVPKGCIEKYKNAYIWKLFEKIEAMGNNSEDEYMDIIAENFPDENFRNYLLEQDYGSDGKLTEEEISIITRIDVSEKNIKSLKGIEYFTALEYLLCSNNNISSIDISKNTKLEYMAFNDNQLTTLDVSYNTALRTLLCNSNQLTSLDVSKNAELTSLYCYSNQLISLDVSNNNLLKILYCSSNQIKGTAMDNLINSLPQNTTDEIYHFTVINTSDSNEGNVCTKAQVAAAKERGWSVKAFRYYNGMTFPVDYEGSDDEPGISVAINEENFPDANFRSYLLSQDYGLDGKLTEDEISNIVDLDVVEKDILSLKGIEFLTALKKLYCGINLLTTLDVSNNKALKELSCYENQLTTLDVSNNTALTELYCYRNQLVSLDASNNKALKELHCYDNQLTSLKVSEKSPLGFLYCYRNQIRGNEMDQLIESLPRRDSNDGFFGVVDIRNEGNVCTKAQVSEIKKKGWTPWYYEEEAGMWWEYEGFDDEPTGFASIGMGTLSDDFFEGETKVEILQDQANKNVYKILNPYRGIVNTMMDEVYEGSKELVITILEPGYSIYDVKITKNDLVYFEPINTGYYNGEYEAYIYLYHPSVFAKYQSEDDWIHNKVIGYQGNGWPYQIQLAPIYYMKDIGGWDASQEDGAVFITFPRDPSGIKGVTIDEDKDVRIYDLMGRRLEKPRKGINIIGGKKVVVK